MLPKSNTIYRNRLFLSKEKLATDAGVTLKTLDENITRIEKEMGFKKGDLSTLVRLSTEAPIRPLKPCTYCSKPTRRKEEYCKLCEHIFRLKDYKS